MLSQEITSTINQTKTQGFLTLRWCKIMNIVIQLQRHWPTTLLWHTFTLKDFQAHIHMKQCAKTICVSVFSSCQHFFFSLFCWWRSRTIFMTISGDQQRSQLRVTLRKCHGCLYSRAVVKLSSMKPSEGLNTWLGLYSFINDSNQDLSADGNPIRWLFLILRTLTLDEKWWIIFLWNQHNYCKIPDKWLYILL